MTLTELWEKVNKEWVDVREHLDHLEDQVFNQGDWILIQLAKAREDLFTGVASTVNDLEWITHQAIQAIDLTLWYIIQGLDITVESNFRNIKRVFYTHMETITTLLEQAVELIGTSGGVNAEYVDNAVYTAEVGIYGAIDNSMDYVDSEIDTVKVDISDIIDTQSIIMQGYIDTKAADIVTSVETLGSDLDEFIMDRFRAAKRYTRNRIADAMIDIDVAITEVNDALILQITNLEKTLNESLGEVVEALVVIMTNLELRVTGKIIGVKAQVEALDVTTAWGSAFFDIFRSTPELSFLQVLLRDDAKFAEFKPYWQALFTRVMSED